MDKANSADAERLQSLAKQHLMLHFSDMSGLAERDIPIIDRGEGSHVFDVDGRRYIDGLSGLYCVNLGHSHGERIGDAAAAQMRQLPFTSNWTVAHPPGIELATRLSELAPPGLDRAFFGSGGADAVESAWKLAVQFHAANGEPARRRVIARKDAYHGVSLGALAMTGIEECRTPFEPLAVPVSHVSNTNAYRHPEGGDEQRLCAALLTEIEETIDAEGAETIAMLIAEPVQNAGGSIVPPEGYWAGLREICDRHGILLCSDEVICAFGRLGYWFGADRFGYVPDLITFAKGLTGAYFSMGGVLISDRVAEPFLDGRSNYLHGYTFGGHPVGAAVALAAIETVESEGVLENVRDQRAACRRGPERAARHPDRRRRSRRRLLLGDRAGPRPGDAGELRRPRRRLAAEGRALRGALEPRPDLQARRPDRTDHPDRAAACRRRRPDRGDRLDHPRGPRGRDRTDGRAARADRRRLAAPRDGVDGDAALDAQQRRVDLEQVEALIEEELAEP